MKKSLKLEKKRLGNFVLLEQRLNTQGSNFPMEKKSEIYTIGQYENGEMKEPPSKMIQSHIISDIINKVASQPFEGVRKSVNFKYKQNKSIIDENENRLIEKKKKNWSIQRFKNAKLITESTKIENPDNQDNE